MKEITHADVQTIREDFCVYRVENGQILKIKQTIVDVKNEKQEDGKYVTNMAFNDISFVITPKPIDTSDLEYMSKEKITAEHQTKELDFKPTREVINIYETEHSIILIALAVEKIFLTNKKDETNAPILRFTMKNGISIIPKISLIQKESEKKSTKN